MQPSRCRVSSNAGIATISFDLPSRGQLRIRAKSAHRLDDCWIELAVDRCHDVSGKGCAGEAVRSVWFEGLGGLRPSVRKGIPFWTKARGCQAAARNPAPPSTCGSRPPTKNRTCRTTTSVAMPRAGLDVVQDSCDVAASGRREGRPQLNALMAAARNHEIDCVLVWKFDRFARSTRHLLTALEEFDHLGVRFVSVQDQIDTDSPMGRAMFTIIGAMAELESSLISERVTAGMRATEARGQHLGHPAIPKRVISAIEALAISTDLSVRQIQAKIAGQASRGIVGEITKRARAAPSPGL